tara:strand:- start:108 stop:356 length:249 start_codon:yes stop_codon:yes gene_type:complete
MAWKAILKDERMGTQFKDYEMAIDVIGQQITVLKNIERTIAEFFSEKDLDMEKLQDLAKRHYMLADAIRTVLITIMEKIEGS